MRASNGGEPSKTMPHRITTYEEALAKVAELFAKCPHPRSLGIVTCPAWQWAELSGLSLFSVLAGRFEERKGRKNRSNS